MRSNSALCSAASSVLSDWSSFRIGGVSKSSPSSEPSSPDSLPLLCPLVSVWKTGLESESVPLILPLCGGAGEMGRFSSFTPKPGGLGSKSSRAWIRTSLVTPESSRALRSSCCRDVSLDTILENIKNTT